ncbi:MAG: alcohol dehydrogenase catalytic domain-containing protein [Dehalococcoidia bacterium]|nr:alcohol dehydrogenase catalytic domain-containing protein [Dehalococcoidia bacterium]
MKTATLFAEWNPKPEFKLGAKDIEGKLTYLGSKVWRHPHIKLVEKDTPVPGPTEVLIEVKACGICGSDVHMLQSDDNGYIFYPGLTAFPSTLGHEFSGVVLKAGKPG